MLSLISPITDEYVNWILFDVLLLCWYIWQVRFLFIIFVANVDNWDVPPSKHDDIVDDLDEGNDNETSIKVAVKLNKSSGDATTATQNCASIGTSQPIPMIWVKFHCLICINHYFVFKLFLL